jgi:hypothetical protein
MQLEGVSFKNFTSYQEKGSINFNNITILIGPIILANQI